MELLQTNQILCVCDAKDFSLVLSSILGMLYSVLFSLGVHGCRTVNLTFSAQSMARELHWHVPTRVTFWNS